MKFDSLYGWKEAYQVSSGARQQVNEFELREAELAMVQGAAHSNHMRAKTPLSSPSGSNNSAPSLPLGGGSSLLGGLLGILGNLPL